MPFATSPDRLSPSGPFLPIEGQGCTRQLGSARAKMHALTDTENAIALDSDEAPVVVSLPAFIFGQAGPPLVPASGIWYRFQIVLGAVETGGAPSVDTVVTPYVQYARPNPPGPDVLGPLYSLENAFVEIEEFWVDSTQGLRKRWTLTGVGLFRIDPADIGAQQGDTLRVGLAIVPFFSNVALAYEGTEGEGPATDAGSQTMLDVAEIRAECMTSAIDANVAEFILPGPA